MMHIQLKTYKVELFITNTVNFRFSASSFLSRPSYIKRANLSYPIYYHPLTTSHCDKSENPDFQEIFLDRSADNQLIQTAGTNVQTGILKIVCYHLSVCSKYYALNQTQSLKSE